MPGAFTVEFFEDDDGRCPVTEWMEKELDDTQLAALLEAFALMLEARGVDVCATEWGRPLGDGLFEPRSTDELTR